jgi:hypothetical protein
MTFRCDGTGAACSLAAMRALRWTALREDKRFEANYAVFRTQYPQMTQDDRAM